MEIKTDDRKIKNTSKRATNSIIKFSISDKHTINTNATDQVGMKDTI